MRTIVLVLATFTLTTGCLVLPTRSTLDTRVGTHDQQRRERGGANTLAVTASTTDVTVTAFRPWTCYREVFEVTEHVTTTSASVDIRGLPNDPASLLIAAMTAPVTMVVSGVITGIVVAATHDTKTTDQRLIQRQRSSCPVAIANVAVAVVLPSGAQLRGVTDAAGRLALTIPDDEPDTGVIVARAPGMAPRMVRYARSAAPGASRGERMPGAPPPLAER